MRMKGELVTPRYLERHGFHYPIMVTEMEGLGLKLPAPTFSVKDVEQYVGKEASAVYELLTVRALVQDVRMCASANETT